MKIFPIEAFSDNYIWIIKEEKEITIVDPGEPKKVLSYLKKKLFNKITILLTHHHEDHIGGVEDIVDNYPSTKVYGPVETSTFNDVTVEDGDTFNLNEKSFEVLKTAGHTEEHISYVLNNKELFCGDALFSAGCGRVFTGDYKSAYEGIKKFQILTDNVNVYAGHEYTETNLKFAQSVEPSNPLIEKALKETEKLRADNLPTLPTTIGKEKKINLFLQAETLEEFTELRNARDQF